MIKTTALANATTTVFAVAYIACAILAFMAPDFYFGIMGTWFHAINLNAVKATTQMSIPSTVLGVITFSIYIWGTTFAIAKMYNYFANK